MDDVWKLITEKLKVFREHWAIWSVIGTGALYLLGYLAIRFQLTMLGIGTGLDVLEAKYFFAGAKFTVYLLATLPSLVLLLLPVASIIWITIKLFSTVARKRGNLFLDAALTRFREWWRNPLRLRVSGIIFSVLVIQFAMRQCFPFSNLLLARALPEPRWLQALLLESGDVRTALFFGGLTGAALVTAGFYAAARCLPTQGFVTAALEVLLALLLAVQVLLLPVNYSYFVANKSFPRVTAIGTEKIGTDRIAWLVWETDKTATFLVGSQTNLFEDRTLVTVPAKEIEKIQITAYDPLFQVLFAHRSISKGLSPP
jgi:hypothetical protein